MTSTQIRMLVLENALELKEKTHSHLSFYASNVRKRFQIQIDPLLKHDGD